MTNMTSSKILSRLSQHRHTQEWKENRWRGLVCVHYIHLCVLASREQHSSWRVSHVGPVIERVMDGDQKMWPRLSWNGIVPLHPDLPSPPLSAHKVADACHHMAPDPKLHLTNSPVRRILTESATLPLLVYFWEVKISGGLLHPVSSALGKLLWCCSDFLPHVNRLRDRGASMMAWGSCCRRRGFKNRTNKAEVFVCGVSRGRCFHLQAPCVMCSCGRRRIKASSVFPTLCVGGEASPTQNSLPHTPSQPPQRQHTSSSNRTPAAKLQISSTLASKREEKKISLLTRC